MQPECRQHPTAQPEGLSKDYSARYSRGMLSLSNYGPYKPCNPWHLSAGLVMEKLARLRSASSWEGSAARACRKLRVGPLLSTWR